MSAITIYGILGSPFLRSVEITLREKGADYRFQPMSPSEMKSPEHLAMHPFGRIPIFEHGDFRLYETQAILRYLDDVFPAPPLTPGNAQNRARMNQVIGIIDWYFFPKAAAPIGFNRVVGPALFGITPDENAIAEALPMARTSIAALDALLGEKPYMTGNNISLADIMLAAQVDLFRFSREGADLLTGTRLEPWLQRMTARASFVATQPPAMLREAA